MTMSRTLEPKSAGIIRSLFGLARQRFPQADGSDELVTFQPDDIGADFELPYDAFRGFHDPADQALRASDIRPFDTGRANN